MATVEISTKDIIGYKVTEGDLEDADTITGENLILLQTLYNFSEEKILAAQNEGMSYHNNYKLEPIYK